MAPSKAPNSWEDSDEESTPPSSPAAPPVARRSKFDDEEDDSDVLDTWEEAEDSDAEREKAKKAAEAKAKAEAAAKANHKSKSQRIEERRQENMRRRQEDDSGSEESEDEADKRARLRESEKASDMKHAEDLFGGAGQGNKRSAGKAVTVQEGDDPANAIDLSSLKIFNPSTVQQFAKLRETLVPLFLENAKKPQYISFLQELNKQVARDLSSDQLKKLSSSFATMSNEKLKEEKAADKSGKKTKAAKTKATLTANRDLASKADTTLYDEDGLDDGDFM